MQVNEIFYSIQGEGVHQGLPTVFIRLQGCNLRCIWCDTVYAQDKVGGSEQSVTSLVNDVDWLTMHLPVLDRHSGLHPCWVCITGGEPLLQTEEVEILVSELKARRYLTEIETNGTLLIPPWWTLIDSWCVDMKCPSANTSGKHESMWLHCRPQDQIKFVVSTETDLEYVKKTLSNHPNIASTVLISPVINLMKTNPIGQEDYYMSGQWLERCVEFCKEHGLRFSLQWHKVIWGSKKGV